MTTFLKPYCYSFHITAIKLDVSKMLLLNWKRIGKWIPIKLRYCASGYIREFQNECHQIIIPVIIIQLITLDAFFFKIFIPITISFLEAKHNSQQQEKCLIELERILEMKYEWDPQTMSLLDNQFANPLFETIRDGLKNVNNSEQAAFRDSIIRILTIIQRHTYIKQGPLFLLHRPEKVYFDLLLKSQQNPNHISTKSESDLLYLLSKIIPENTMIRMYLYRKGLYEYLVHKTDDLVTLNIISSDTLRCIKNLTFLLFILFKYQDSNLYQEFEPWWMPKFKLILFVIKSTLKFINNARHRMDLNLYIQSCLVNITKLISLISTTRQPFCIEEFIDYFEGDPFFIFINLVKSNYKEVRLNVINFINNIFMLNHDEAQDAVLKTGIIHQLLPISCIYEQGVVINIWANVFELGGNDANALLNDDKTLGIIMKQLQYHLATDIRCAFRCAFEIFEDESLPAYKLIYFKNGILIDILCQKFNEIDSSSKQSVHRYLLKQFNIWPMIFDCFEEVILQMKHTDNDLIAFIVGKLRENNIMQIFKDLHLYDDNSNCFILNWWNWTQYAETFNFMKTMLTD